ncbi:D-TA family PLP-dependent enzyme [Chelatococcus sambhunathii]|uniref:D-TA family PLP-dependent enzyme n=1 Tax=Chelatococcus sambhunathii TaxID=363953 RepID=A0ABU1DJG3_9HYPH|nr:D-TA family PLP-dependent enzyme [Chelatococcus sambhunathii]MDR4308258.1 D-TA family PLP-dependent enzyme [Chelatococcus sambhunathii]
MTPLAAAVARAFGTPAVVVDLDVVESNIARVQALCDRAGLACRPHVKTHKSPELAQLQVAAGAKGITCQKLGEAEVMADGGLDDILISYNILGERNLGRLGALMRRVKMTVAADSATTVDGLARAAAAGGRTLDVVVECDTGLKRAGVETPGEAVELARRIAATPGLAFAGLLLYPPPDRWPETQAFFDAAQAGLRDAGLEPRIVSTGGSPNLKHLGALDGATEHRPGTYIFNDRMQVAAGVATLQDCAVSVYATVVSRAAPDRGIVDAGSKILTSDPGGLSGHGFVLDLPEARINALSEEHGFLDLSASAARPPIGEVVRIVPNHVCVVVNMVDRLVAVRGEAIVGEIAVAARGMSV